MCIRLVDVVRWWLFDCLICLLSDLVVSPLWLNLSKYYAEEPREKLRFVFVLPSSAKPRGRYAVMGFVVHCSICLKTIEQRLGAGTPGCRRRNEQTNDPPFGAVRGRSCGSRFICVLALMFVRSVLLGSFGCFRSGCIFYHSVCDNRVLCLLFWFSNLLNFYVQKLVRGRFLICHSTKNTEATADQFLQPINQSAEQ